MRVMWTLALSALAGLFLLSQSVSAQVYQLQPGDILRIEVIEDPTLNRDVLVSPDGRISFPLAGAVTAGGRSIEQVQALLTDALAPNFAALPTVFVGLRQVGPPGLPEVPEVEEPVLYSIYVLGEVGSAGRIDVEPGTDILQLFALIGGFTDFAATKRIQLRRLNADGAEEIYALNYDLIEQGISPYGRAVLRDGDTFIVPVRRLFE